MYVNAEQIQKALIRKAPRILEKYPVLKMYQKEYLNRVFAR